jgi:hypothetical protein
VFFSSELPIHPFTDPEPKEWRQQSSEANYGGVSAPSHTKHPDWNRDKYRWQIQNHFRLKYRAPVRLLRQSCAGQKQA